MDARLVNALRDAYHNAPQGSVVVRIHLFGIRNARDLRGVNLFALVDEAGVPRSFHTEIRKGIRLAEYVDIRSHRADGGSQ
jgi:hypothetical protein